MYTDCVRCIFTSLVCYYSSMFTGKLLYINIDLSTFNFQPETTESIIQNKKENIEHLVAKSATLK